MVHTSPRNRCVRSLSKLPCRATGITTINNGTETERAGDARHRWRVPQGMKGWEVEHAN